MRERSRDGGAVVGDERGEEGGEEGGVEGVPGVTGGRDRGGREEDF